MQVKAAEADAEAKYLSGTRKRTNGVRDLSIHLFLSLSAIFYLSLSLPYSTRKATNGVSTSGVTANFMFSFDEGTLGGPPLA